MGTSSALRISSILLAVVLLTGTLTSAAPYNDYDNLRDLYEIILRKEAAGELPNPSYNHQMERKGGRSPSLRLRFGRRTDPLWHSLSPSEGVDGPASNWKSSFASNEDDVCIAVRWYIYIWIYIHILWVFSLTLMGIFSSDVRLCDGWILCPHYGIFFVLMMPEIESR